MFYFRSNCWSNSEGWASLVVEMSQKECCNSVGSDEGLDGRGGEIFSTSYSVQRSSSTCTVLELAFSRLSTNVALQHCNQSLRWNPTASLIGYRSMPCCFLMNNKSIVAGCACDVHVRTVCVVGVMCTVQVYVHTYSVHALSTMQLLYNISTVIA